ncbi:MAG TPA: rod shape-determining protein RodA [Prolixibacteraceae bacterium]|nr:rod shape-determining protein RodA [Prolixibacteraceae bacterium]
MIRSNKIALSVDWGIILIYLFLVAVGWVNIFSVGYSEEQKTFFDFSQRYGKQLVWIVMGLLVGAAVLYTDSKFFVSFAYLIYAFFILMLVLVLLVGNEVNGAKSWLTLGGVGFQPSEFAKLGTALALSRLVSSYNFSIKNNVTRLKILALILLPVALILLQHDTGSALVYLVFLIPLFREGLSGLILFFCVLFVVLFILSLKISPLVLLVVLIALASLVYYFLKKNGTNIAKGMLLLLVNAVWITGLVWLIKGHFPGFYYVLFRASLLSGLIVLGFAYYKKRMRQVLVSGVFVLSILFSFSVDFAFERVLEPHHQDRINHLLGIESDPLGAGYNVNQSKIAIGSGGFVGKGFLKGTQTKFDFVPEQSTDFIFCTIGEEWGFVGSAVVLFLFIFLIVRMILISEKQRSVFSRFYGYCVASIFFFHFAINIGMTIGLAPVIGIPLPFLSYGGSSLWFFTLLLFVLLRLDANRMEQLH